jgi:uncharacterized protein (UPF0548 family)
VDLSKLDKLPLTYSEVGATRGTLPDGYHHIGVSDRIGHGRKRFEQAAGAVMHWGMQRGSGLRIQTSSDVATVDAVVVVRLGFVGAPCRVVYVVDDDNRRGFGYGTLPGHPESGEESFSVSYDPGDDAVYAEVRAFSRPATWWSRAGGPVIALGQRVIAGRYLRAV